MTSNSALEFIAMEINTDVKLSNTDDIAGSASATTESMTPEDDAKTLSGVFTIDILPEIFDNLGILTTKDLLNFRLVSRSWRDAATSVLLKRNLCRIILGYVELTFDEGEGGNAVVQANANLDEMGPNENHSQSTLRSDRYFNVNQPKSILSDLSQLISTSPKFPSTRICFYNLCPANSNHENQQDLVHFFSLYGKKINQLSLSFVCSMESREAGGVYSS